MSPFLPGLVAVLALAGALASGCTHDRAPGQPPPAPPTAPASVATSAPSALPSPGAPSVRASSSAVPVASAAPLPEPKRLTIRLVPLGKVPADTMEQTVRGLREHAPVNPVVEEPREFPARARSPRAGAWQATILLDWLDALPLPRDGKVMGVTEADIVTRKGNTPIWGILGMGSIDGRCSVISTYRMRRRFEGGGAPESLVRERLWKIAIHELGHTLGLDHCPKVGCIMEDGHGTVKTIDRDDALCADCAQQFAASLERSAR